jgi:hypothetical protein
MPKALTLCIDCDALVVRGRCDACERAHKDRVNKRVGPKRDNHVEVEVRNWRMIRANYLRKHPTCEDPTCSEPATDVHHRIDRADGGDSSDANLEALCKSHHSRITARRQARLVPR